MVPFYLLVLPITIAEYVYYEANDPHRGVKTFGFVMAALCGAALIGYACWVIFRRHRRRQAVLPPPVAFNPVQLAYQPPAPPLSTLAPGSTRV